MIGHQQPACIHNQEIGSYCDKCGVIVGVNGPNQIVPGQVWRARGAPYGKVGVISAQEGEVKFYQQEGVQSWKEADFRDEFWYWGTPRDSGLLAAFKDKVEPAAKRFVESKSLLARLSSVAELTSAITDFRSEFKVAPTLHIHNATLAEPLLVIEWPNEAYLKPDDLS